MRVKQTLLAAAVAVSMTALPAALQMSSAAADTLSQSETLVALGDSVTFGFNLDDTNHNTTPSAHAYPSLMGQDKGLTVTNLGVPGWTSTDLLHALGSSNFARALEGASVVTVDIGNNDLLGLAGELGLLSTAAKNPTTPITLTADEQAKFQAAIAQFGQNLPVILADIRKDTSAPIVLYNLYNPFPQGTALYTVTDQFETLENGIIAKTAASLNDTVVADDHALFEGNQLTFVRVAEGDVHPTVLGQQALAKAGETALASVWSNVVSAKTAAAAQTNLLVGGLNASGGALSGTLGGATVSLGIPAGSLNGGAEVDLTSQGTAAVAGLVAASQKAVYDIAVNLTSGATLSKPYTLTIENAAIPAGAAVYSVQPSGLSLVSGATVSAGKVTLSATTGGEFVVVAPSSPTVAGGTSPVTGLPWASDAAAALALMAGGVWLMIRNRRRAHQVR